MYFFFFVGSCDMPPQIPARPRQMMAHKILQQSREAENALADALVSLPPNVLVSIITLFL